VKIPNLNKLALPSSIRNAQGTRVNRVSSFVVLFIQKKHIAQEMAESTSASTQTFYVLISF
jgi:hypothetical protein